MSKLTAVYNGYTIEFLVNAASKLGLATPETDAEFETLAQDIKNRKEYQVILDVMDNFEKEDTQRSEPERVIHAFMADLAGTRKSLQDQHRNELVRSFCELIFKKAVEKLLANPFALNVCVFINERDFKQYAQIRSMIISEGSYSVSERITNLVSDLDIKKVKIDTSCNMLGIIINFE